MNKLNYLKGLLRISTKSLSTLVTEDFCFQSM